MDMTLLTNMLNFVRILKAYPNGVPIKRLQSELEIDHRTLYRLRDYTSDAFKVAIESKPDPDGATNARKWVLVDKNLKLPTPQNIDDQTWLLMQLSLNRGGHADLAKQKTIMKEIESIIDSSFINALSDVPIVVAKTQGYCDYSKHNEVLDALGKSFRNKKCIWIEYQTPWSDEVKKYEIAPYAIIDLQGFLYIIANVPHHDSMISLAVNRIITASLSDRDYAIPKNFNPHEHISDSFGIIVGKPFRVEVQLFNDAAVYAQERIWGKDQKITRHRNGSISLSFMASGLHELRNWVLSYGSNALVKRPNKLKDMVEKEYKIIAERMKA